LVHYSPLPFYFPHPLFQQLSIHILISSAFKNVVFYNITMLYHSLFFFLFP
jgi:hypothetical protein